MGTDSSVRATTSPATWRFRTPDFRARVAASTAWPCWLPPGTSTGQREVARTAAHSIDALVGRGIESAVEPRGNEETSLGRASTPLAGAVPHLGDGIPRDPRKENTPNPGGSHALVPPRRLPRPGCLPLRANAAAARCGRSRTGRGQPSGAPSASVFSRRVPLRGAHYPGRSSLVPVGSAVSAFACLSMTDAEPTAGSVVPPANPAGVPPLAHVRRVLPRRQRPRAVPRGRCAWPTRS